MIPMRLLALVHASLTPPPRPEQVPLNSIFVFLREEGDKRARSTSPGTKVSEATNEAKLRFDRFSPWRRLVTTKDYGYVGMAPYNAARGDVVYCFPGYTLPLLLREVPCEWHGEENRTTYKIVSSIYIHGIMQGEALSGVNYDELEKVSIW